MSSRPWSSSEPLLPEPRDTWHQNLLQWYDIHGRTMPWRETRDPYSVWVSEVMLQQTQVVTMTPYYERWMARFPTFAALADADEQEVLALWQGLGYYRRARNLHAGARQITAQGVPATRDAWLSIAGVGRYTAGALCSITLGLAEPVVDGNVERVYARMNEDGAADRQLHANAWNWATSHMHADRPGDWNQSLMELGATVCKPVNPECPKCPVQAWCGAHQSGRVSEFPAKGIRRKAIQMKQSVRVPVYEGLLGVRQIPAGKWWEGMWEFPCGSSEMHGGSIQPLGQIRFSVTHHRITMDATLHHCESAAEGLRWLSAADLAELPMPAPQRRVLKLAVLVLA